jgi:dUTP pyrophosphatase
MTYILHLYTENPELKALYQNHKTVHVGDSGIDLFIPENYHNLDGNKTYFISHEIICWMTDISGNLVSYYLYPRSSLSKTALRMANSVGIIDSGYRGNIIAAIDTIANRDESLYIIDKHSRLFQICEPKLSQIKLVVEDEIVQNSTRGTDGFGSTGK